MNNYQQEQLEAQTQIADWLGQCPTSAPSAWRRRVAAYIDFRKQVDQYLNRNFNSYCTTNCYQNNLSACCSKDGITTFYADLFINALVSDSSQLDRLKLAIEGPLHARKCIYLGKTGCLMMVRPVVCAMFLCSQAQQEVFAANESVKAQWADFRRQAKAFRWPDQPVLFDDIEQAMIAAGYQSPLMYLHNSPGLLRVKQKAGLVTAASRGQANR